MLALMTMMCLTGVTAHAEWTGGTSSGGINDGTTTGNGTWGSYGLKFSIARRADMLTAGDINRGNYAGYTRGGAGLVVLKDASTFGGAGDRNDIVNKASEFIVDNGKLVTVSNANVSTSEAAQVLGVESSTLDSTLRNMVDEGHLSGKQNPDYHAHFRFEGLADYVNKQFSDVYNPDGMLYDAEKRGEFYDRFTAELSEQGIRTGITKEEFLSKDGVLIVTPVVCLEGGAYLSFPTANEIVDKGLSSVFKTIYDVTGNKYSERQIPYGDANGTVAVSELAQYYTMHDYDNKPINNQSGGLSDILARKYQGLNWRYGFGVLGLSYSGDSKASASITVRATQKDDGSYTLDSRASMISQKAGDMPVDEKMVSGTTENKDITGGYSETSDVSTLVTNINEKYEDKYETFAYGSFLASGSGNLTAESDLEAVRKELEGETDAQVTSVNSANFNAGNVYKPVYKHRTPQDTASYFAQSAISGNVSERLVQNMMKNGEALPRNLSYNLTALANNKSKVTSSDLKSSNGSTAGTGEVTMSGGGQNLGVAVQYLVKEKPVESRISYAKLSYDDKLVPSLSVGGSEAKKHTLADEATFSVKSKRFFVAMVANADANDTYELSEKNPDGKAFWNKVKESLSAGDVFEVTEYQEKVGQYLSEINTTTEGAIQNSTVAVGSKNGEGYSVYILEIEAPEKLTVDAEVHLDDYQLNKIHSDILASTKGILTNSGESVVSLNSVKENKCLFSDEVHKQYGVSNTYNLSSTDQQKGTTLDADKSSNEKLIYYNSLLGKSYTRNQIDEVVKNISELEPKRYTYAFNLSRGVHGDKRTISALSSNSLYADEKEVLINTHKNDYGIQIGGKTSVEPKRDSKATYMSEVKDKFSFKGIWSEGGNAPKGAVLVTHEGVIPTEDGNILARDQYEVLNPSGARPLKYNGLPLYQLDVNLKETIYKYSTDVMEVGKTLYAGNKEFGTLGDISHLNYNGFRADLAPAERYKVAVGANATCEEIKFYPEVRMRAYFANGTETISKGSVVPRTVITLAEEVRKVQPKSMYLMRIETDETDKQAIGTVFSDTMGTGDVAGESNKPVIYAGSDVTLNLDVVKPKLRLYGYALDLVNYDVDKDGFAVGGDTVLPYKTVVNDMSVENRDPYSTWGNKDSTNELFKQYVNWASSVKNSLYADVTLKVEGSGVQKQYNNFNVSMSDLVDENEAAHHKQSGVYPLYIRRGEIDTSSGGYQMLLEQIKADYQCSDKEAKALFEESNMYQTILKAVEDTKDDFNRSQKVNTEENGVHAVRAEDTEDNWYDEEVKTFVVRRYESEPIEFKDIILSDKLDYNMAPDSTAGIDNETDAMQDYFNYAEGKWYLTLYFRDSEKEGTNLYLSEGKKYNPKEGNINTNEAYFKGGNVLINNLYINGADFSVPSATTSDMLW